MGLNRVLGLLLIFLSLVAGWAWTDYRHFLETPVEIAPEGRVYELQRGAAASVLWRDFAAADDWRAQLYLRLMARFDPRMRQLKAGEYALPRGITPPQLVAILSSGQSIQYPVTLIEGWNFRELRDVLSRHAALAQTLTGLDAAAIMQRLGRPDAHPEGRFLPDTYHFPRGTEDLEVLRRAMEAMDRELALQWAQRAPDLPFDTPYQALTLASIVEKETGLAEERPQIAGVFIRRLQKGMRLQTDPTVIYGLADRFDGNLRRADLQADTPYNTYVHAGLPPTPIAMPGREAIRAALHPADGQFLYFVAKGDGSHAFSASLAAHNAAVRQYQLKR